MATYSKEKYFQAFQKAQKKIERIFGTLFNENDFKKFY